MRIATICPTLLILVVQPSWEQSCWHPPWPKFEEVPIWAGGGKCWGCSSSRLVLWPHSSNCNVVINMVPAPASSWSWLPEWTPLSSCMLPSSRGQRWAWLRYGRPSGQPPYNLPKMFIWKQSWVSCDSGRRSSAVTAKSENAQGNIYLSLLHPKAWIKHNKIMW